MPDTSAWIGCAGEDAQGHAVAELGRRRGGEAEQEGEEEHGRQSRSVAQWLFTQASTAIAMVTAR